MIALYLVFALFLEASCSSFEITENEDTNKAASNTESSYVDQRQLLKTLSFQSFRVNSKVSSLKRNSSHRVSFLDRGSALSIQLRQIANSELGVTKLQDSVNSLPYVEFDTNEESILAKMVESLDEKLKLYGRLVQEMTDIVKKSYQSFKEKTLNSRNLVLDFTHGGQITEDEPEYYPCCVIPDHYLIFNSHFGTKVNTELWCDSGIEQDILRSHHPVFFTPAKLTELFSVNHRLYPNLKWQFFMSASGVHTEFPAHRSGTSIGSECGQSSRHHQIYEKTIRPNGRNIVLLYDLGHTLRPRLLLTAKAIGHYIIDTLTTKDNIAMLSIGGSVSLPTPTCLKSQLVPADYDVKQSLRQFIDYLEFQDVPTNHSMGFDMALKLIEDWQRSQSRSNRGQMSVLLTYITRGLLGDLNEAANVMQFLAKKVDAIRAQIVISAFALGISHSEQSFQTQFLESLVNQDYLKYGLKVKRAVTPGEIIAVPSTLRVAQVIKDFYDVVEKPVAQLTGSRNDRNVTVSKIYWDTQGNGMVITFSKAVFGDSGEVAGVVGLDLPLSYLLEDASYYTSPRGGYAVVMDTRGNVLYHPKIGRIQLLNSPLLDTPTTLLEPSPAFVQLAHHMLRLPSGHRRNNRVSPEDTREYWWMKADSLQWIFIISHQSGQHLSQKLSPNAAPLPSHALFHRLDLLSPQEAKVCRHFNQMATLDGGTIFLSAGAYLSPSTYLAKSFRNMNVDMNIMAYLMDHSKLLVNRELKEVIKGETAALYHIAAYWKDLFQSSKHQKYIIRRYGATISGVTLIYPGTLLDSSYDPVAQGWFIKALERPGEVVVTPPFLDPGGAGYIVTVSHTVYQGRPAALHSPSDPVLAVLAADFTLGYWHKLLADIEPLCTSSIYFKDLDAIDRKSDSSIRCFLMDTSGYLIVHPSFVDPLSLRELGGNSPRHITHQESVLSMSLLGKGIGSTSQGETPVLKKIWCGKQWKGSSERYYSVDIEAGELISSASDNVTSNGQKSERACLQYKLTAVPGSNLILGFINQTCSPPTAFCPCSTVERPCLNCQFMENAACECPCECALPSQPCSNLPYVPLTLQKGQHDSAKLNVSSGHESGGDGHIEKGRELTGAPISCPRTPEAPGPMHYDVGMLSQLSVCLPIMCEAHTTNRACLGVLDCVWCVLESDGVTPLDTPHCTQSHKCYGGIRGGPSPYPPGLAPLPHSEERGSSLPIVPVVGGVLVVFLVMGVAIYFYRTYFGIPAVRTAYTPTSLQSQTHPSPLYTTDTYPDLENGDETFLEDGIISAEAAAAISPYRMNPTYRRPPLTQGEASDHGYSTMTPHEESDNITYTDLATASLFPASSLNDTDRASSNCWSDNANNTEMVSQMGASRTQNHNMYDSTGYTSMGGVVTYQTPLSSPKRIGPNKILVPVTVHMVDSV